MDVARGVRDVHEIPVLLMEKKGQECCTTDDGDRDISLEHGKLGSSLRSIFVQVGIQNTTTFCDSSAHNEQT